MRNKNFFNLFCSSIIFIGVLAIKIGAQNPCPNYSDLLDKGWAAPLHDPHYPQQANRDEFATVNSTPFILKVNDYPPVKSFPIIPYSGCNGNTFYYFSFDTDGENLPINHWVMQNEDNSVKTYKIDQGGNYVAGYSLTLRPPSTVEVGSPPDFVMKYDGTMHDIAWNINIYPWENIVQNVASYIPQGLSVVINGVDNLNYNSSLEFIADINGGSGNYLIIWSIKNLPGGDWVEIKGNYIQQNYYNIYGSVYIYYDDEYKFSLTMPDNDIELKVEVMDNVTSEYVIATKVVTVNPEAVTFINHIETSENSGSLILNENHSDPIASGDSRDLVFGNNYTIRTDELPFIVDWNSTGKTEKQYQWELTSPILYSLNRNFTFEGTTQQTMKSRFLSTEPATIKTLVDGVELSGLNMKFSDPWYYYEDLETNNWFQSNEFKSYVSPLNLYNNFGLTYGGIFLNQEVSPDHPYYSVQSPLTQTANLGGVIGTRNFYFQTWSTSGGASLQQVGSNPPGYDQKAVVFTSTGATVNANLKGQLMSNDQNAISSASQRKMVRTDNGQYHVVYESMGTVWYTFSLTNNFYGSWKAEELLHTHGKNPSIDYEGNTVKIVFEYYDPQVGGNAKIHLVTYELGSPMDYEEVTSYPNSYYGNAKPVISYTQWEVFIAYRTGPTGGIKQKTKWYSINWDWGSETDIPGTNADCKNPSVTGLRHPGCIADIHIAYENFGAIYFRQATRVATDWNWNYFSLVPTNLSAGCGFNLNRYPVISLSDNSPSPYLMVSWQGIYDANQTNPLPKIDGTKPLYRQAAVVKTGYGISWSTPSSFSNNVDYTSNGSLNVLYGSIMTWSESNGQYSKYVRRRNPTGYDAITPLSTNGIHTLVSNGTEFVIMKAMVFNKSTNAPYFLNRCTDDFTYIPDELGKISEAGIIDIGYGRSGIVEKNGIECVFNIEDVLLNGETIKFIERIDTLPVTSIEELNSAVRTDTLNLNPQSELIFSDYYYVVNSEKADSLLSNDFNINFKCELVKLSTGEVVGEFEEVNYNKSNLEEYGYQGYLVDCSGIEAGDYYLRLTSSVNEEVGLSLSDIQMDNVVLEKSKLNVRNFKGSSIPLEYALEQNYPNPFNPATTIRFQLPKDGMVTLRVYDILGAEVKTLVNEEKIAGKYEVNFNASSLASGVYIYRLNVNEYTSVKKMVLLK